jgi:hypothetical protein
MGVQEINRDRAGQTAYDAYARERGGVTVAGQIMWS